MEKRNFDPFIERVPRLREAGPRDAEALIQANPAYGNVVCRCEKVSEAEVVAAIRKGHLTMDGIKYFTRAGMGRCQGGFCTSRILKILMRETGLSPGAVTKKGRESFLLRGAVHRELHFDAAVIGGGAAGHGRGPGDQEARGGRVHHRA